MTDTKKCPYCKEEIQADAVKCRYCKEWLEENKESKKIEKENNIEKAMKDFERRIKKNYPSYEISDRNVENQEMILKKSKSPFNGCVFAILFLCGIIPGLLYALIVGQKNIKDSIVVEFDKDGNVVDIDKDYFFLKEDYNDGIEFDI